jgi:hypothetical protein
MSISFANFFLPDTLTKYQSSFFNFVYLLTDYNPKKQFNVRHFFLISDKTSFADLVLLKKKEKPVISVYEV